MMKILWNFACRHRKEKLFAAVENIIEMATTDDYVILVKLDNDDHILNDIEVYNKLNSYGDKVRVTYGFSKNKVDAINRDIWTVPDFDILVSWADDQIILKPGFDRRLVHYFLRSPHGLFSSPHFPDGHVNEKLVTCSIMGKLLYDFMGYVYHPDFAALFCDNLYMDLVRQLGVYKYVPESWYEHAHPLWTKQPFDQLLQHTESFYKQDQATYVKLRSNNFGINKPIKLPV